MVKAQKLYKASKLILYIYTHFRLFTLALQQLRCGLSPPSGLA